MASLAETLIVAAVIGGVAGVACDAVAGLDQQVQDVVFEAQIESAADCALAVFAQHGVDPAVGARLAVENSDPAFTANLAACVEPITGIPGEALRSDPAAVLDLAGVNY